MKALVIPGKNRPLEWRNLDDLRAGPGEAIVKVYAAALNHRDVWIQRGQYAGLRYPIVVGSDGAGVVASVGTDTDGDVDPVAREVALAWIGKEVILDPALHWGANPAFQDPTGFGVLGLPDDGTLAEYVKIPVRNLVEKPTSLSFVEASALPLAGGTAYRALITRACLCPGERVLITGIGGGVALFAMQMALAAGAKVYVTSGSEEKLASALSMGANGGVNYRHTSWVEALRSMAGGFDVILDGAVGDSMSDLLDLALPGARLVIYGATRGNPSNVVIRRIFWKQLNVLGSTMADPEDFRAMVSFVSKHGIRPMVDKVYPPQEGEAAFRRLEEGLQFGKIIIDMR